jgi:hypothetical protein
MPYVVKRIGDRGRECIVRRHVENKVDLRRMRDERATNAQARRLARHSFGNGQEI